MKFSEPQNLGADRDRRVTSLQYRAYRTQGDIMSTTFYNADPESKIVQTSIASVGVNPRRRRILPMLIVTVASLVSLTWAGFLVWAVGHLFGLQN